MTHRFRHVVVVAVAAAWLSAPAGAQQPQQAPAPDHEAHHRDMLARGAQAMGFDQERTNHHFVLSADGGAIEVTVKEASDAVNLRAVRQHLMEIAGLFKAGDFGKPALTHAQQVPGTADMARLKDRISYKHEETPGGGRVRIVTADAEALAAVHAFLHFQIEDHGTGDSGVVQRSMPGQMMHGMGRGTMMNGPGRGMMMGGHDAATVAQMGDVHALFMSHDQITRTVTKLSNGVRTVTESADPRVAQLLKDHVTQMGQRVDAGDDPGLPIESPALRLIYRNHSKIHTTFEPTPTGIAVVQTSSDAETVAALQQHASEVTDFVNEGMAAMRAAMMKNGGMAMPKPK